MKYRPNINAEYFGVLCKPMHTIIFIFHKISYKKKMSFINLFFLR